MRVLYAEPNDSRYWRKPVLGGAALKNTNIFVSADGVHFDFEPNHPLINSPRASREAVALADEGRTGNDAFSGIALLHSVSKWASKAALIVA
jgi:hypothetical protein